MIINAARSFCMFADLAAQTVEVDIPVLAVSDHHHCMPGHCGGSRVGRRALEGIRQTSR